VDTVLCDLEHMPRELRQDYPGAMHHITTRGVARCTVAADAVDFRRGLTLLERAVTRFELRCHAWSFLPNHSHLLVTSRLGNISDAMQWFGTCTAQAFNQRYERSGHLYQGRFGSRIVKSDTHFLELARYLPLNPVRAGLCETPQAWPWSSYAATTGFEKKPPFLDARDLLETFGSADGYTAWVAEGMLATFLDEDGVPRPLERPPLDELLVEDSDRAIAAAHFRHGYTMAAIARHLGVHRSQVSRRLRRHT
jgi:putative transposase